MSALAMLAPDSEGGFNVTGTSPSTSSCARAESVTTAPLGAVASTVAFDGRSSTGGSTSGME